ALNILFLEDDQVDQMAIQRMANKNDLIADYIICDSISAAVKALKVRDFDIVVSDYHLKDGIGVEIIEKSNGKPVIVVTGMGDESLAVDAMKAGAVDYIIKDHHNSHLDILPIAIEKAYRQHAQNMIYQEAEQRYHDLFENSSDLIQSVDMQGKFVYVNPSWLAALGYTEKEVEKLSFLDIIHPDFHKHSEPLLEDLKKGKTHKNEEIWFVSKDGETIIVEGNMSCRFDSANNPITTRGIFRDVTENRIAQAKLRENEKKYRLLVESANDIIYYADVKGTCKFINKHGPTFTGYSQKELIGFPFYQMVDPDFTKKVSTFYKDQFNKKVETTYLEFPIIKKNGKKFWVGQSVRTLYDEDDPSRIDGYLGIVRDINDKKLIEEQLKISNQVLEKRVLWRTRELEKTNKKLLDEIKLRVNTEKALKESEKEYRNLFQNAHDAIIIFDPKDEKVLEVNEKACEVYEFDREEFIGMSLKKVYDSDAQDSNLLKKVKGTGYSSFETTHSTKTGRQMILEVHATKVVYKGSKAILSMNKDVTVKRETERKLVEERTRRVSALIDGQEMERKRLSRELHDGLGQLLTASLIYLKQLYDVVDGKKAEDLVDKTREIIEDTVTEVRSISHNLMPAVLHDFGLELALKNMINSINGKFKGSIKFRSKGEIDRLNSDVEIGLYRIAQEALNNALKYAKADKIDIALRLL
ncbi:MAG: PAS domain S-box protein, partial [Bacteroidota bacterium]